MVDIGFVLWAGIERVMSYNTLFECCAVDEMCDSWRRRTSLLSRSSVVEVG